MLETESLKHRHVFGCIKGLKLKIHKLLKPQAPSHWLDIIPQIYKMKKLRWWIYWCMIQEGWLHSTPEVDLQVHEPELTVSTPSFLLWSLIFVSLHSLFQRWIWLKKSNLEIFGNWTHFLVSAHFLICSLFTVSFFEISWLVYFI